jgi:nitrite reductase (NO-forming)
MNRYASVGAAFLAAVLIVVGIVAVSPGDGASGAATAEDFRVHEPNGNVVEVNLVARETTQEIAPGVDYQVWTFNGVTPAPVIRVNLGDTVRFTLTNDSSIGMQHSIDFHAALTPWSENYQPVDPGETLTFDWVAMYPGVFMYHCGVDPVLQHIGNGMYGAIIVQTDAFPAEREFVMVASEFYPTARPIEGLFVGDLDRMKAVDPEYVVFDGFANRYLDAPLQVRPDEPFRIWVVNAGPTLTNAFHVIGTLFPHVYASGNPTTPLNGLQTWNIPPGDGAMFELQIPDEGTYPFVTHSFAYTGRGSVGAIEVTADAPPAPDRYPTFGDPFTAGVLPFRDAGTPPEPTESAEPSATDAPQPTPSENVAPAGECSPKGTTIDVMAMNSAFDADCLAAPAGEPFEIVFDNMDAGIPHNVAIYTDETASTALFVGETINGPDVITYEVPALDAGTYFFRCDVHPTTMTGTFVVA